MTRFHRALIPTILITAVCIAGAIGWAAAASPAASPHVYSLTLTGTDAHSLDPWVIPQFVPGGGVVGFQPSDANATAYKYMELGLTLPVGAKVTSISVTGKACMGGAPVVFGSYSPATRNTVDYTSFNIPGGCTPKTVTKSTSVTIAAGRRYAIDDDLITLSVSDPADGNEDTLYGATVKYTCTSPCVP